MGGGDENLGPCIKFNQKCMVKSSGGHIRMCQFILFTVTNRRRSYTSKVQPLKAQSDLCIHKEEEKEDISGVVLESKLPVNVSLGSNKGCGSRERRWHKACFSH